MTKGILIFLVLVFGGGATGTYLYFADPLGIDEENPLGKLQNLDRFFGTHQMRKLNEQEYQSKLIYVLRDEEERKRKKDITTVHIYASADEGDRRQNREVIHVMTDASGKVRALAGKCLQRGDTMQGTVIGSMLQNLYVELAGAEPTFTGFELTNRIATFGNGRIEGKWYLLQAWDKTEEIFLFTK